MPEIHARPEKRIASRRSRIVSRPIDAMHLKFSRDNQPVSPDTHERIRIGIIDEIDALDLTAGGGIINENMLAVGGNQEHLAIRHRRRVVSPWLGRRTNAPAVPSARKRTLGK